MSFLCFDTFSPLQSSSSLMVFLFIVIVHFYLFWTNNNLCFVPSFLDEKKCAEMRIFAIVSWYAVVFVLLVLNYIQFLLACNDFFFSLHVQKNSARALYSKIIFRSFGLIRLKSTVASIHCMYGMHTLYRPAKISRLEIKPKHQRRK